MANNKIREEEVKNRIRQEFFQDYDATPILGDIDFAVTTKKSSEGELFDQEYFLWAEAKAGNTEDIYASFVQLIITIGKAHTHESYLPPRYLGAFDEEKKRLSKKEQYKTYLQSKKLRHQMAVHSLQPAPWSFLKKHTLYWMQEESCGVTITNKQEPTLMLLIMTSRCTSKEQRPQRTEKFK